ncbi:MAG: anhydro-N-acetylmuramic acid kinase [Flavobacteriia bacterium]|nr:anhydro-N-acetylmuramic acid kinase [Flavobacteriia bacterium]
MDSYKIIGLMSGTSLDGVDLVYAAFNRGQNGQWSYSIEQSETIAFPDSLLDQLHESGNLLGSQLAQLDHDLGVFFATIINDFVLRFQIDKSAIDAIASHGQTVYHQPAKGFTTQIGNPAVIAFHTEIPTIGDFRTKDVLYGGQGAPLVPIGDRCLFKNDAAAFLNIGGFTNISFEQNGVTRAFDICPGNLPLNKLVRSKDLSYDKDGLLARTGELNYFLLDLLNSLPYYEKKAPKSLGTEWLEQDFYPLLKFDKDIENNLATVVEHIAIQIGKTLNDHQLESVMITGGGAKNSYLIERLKRYFKGTIILPDAQLIDFKEALIFALLGVLFLEKEPNCIASVTGASKDVCGGVLHLP